MFKQKQFLAIVLILGSVILAGCDGGISVADSPPTRTLIPLVSKTPLLTATPVLSKTPLPTSTLEPSETPIPPTPSNTFTPTEVPPVIGIINSLQTVNIRSGPGVDFPAFIALDPGTGVEVIDENEDGTWLNVQLEDGDEGWVSSRLVRVQPSPTPFPSFTPSPDLTALALGTPLPTAVIGSGTVTPTPPRSAVSPTPVGNATATLAATTDVPPTVTLATPEQETPGPDLTAINLTATALSEGRDTPVPATEVSGNPTATLAVGETQPTSPPVSGDVQQGVDVLAYCNNPAYGSPPPTDLAAGSTIDVFWGWFARTPEQVRQHINNVVYEVRLDGELIENWEQTATSIDLESDGNYHVYWYVRSEPLDAGDHRITYRVTWENSITDGYGNFGPGTPVESEEGACDFTVR